LSFGLFEERVMDELEGRMLNPDFLFYKLAGPREIAAWCQAGRACYEAPPLVV
jgi:hypothetical protein